MMMRKLTVSLLSIGVIMTSMHVIAANEPIQPIKPVKPENAELVELGKMLFLIPGYPNQASFLAILAIT